MVKNFKVTISVYIYPTIEEREGSHVIRVRRCFSWGLQESIIFARRLLTPTPSTYVAQESQRPMYYNLMYTNVSFRQCSLCQHF